MTIQQIHARLIDEAQQQERSAAAARADGNEKLENLHAKAALILRERAALIAGGKS